MLSLAGMFRRDPWYAVLGASGLVLAAWYLLTMLQSVFFGPPRAAVSENAAVRDISLRELAAILPIAAACLWIGLRPQPLVELIRPEVEAVARLYDDRVERDGLAAIPDVPNSRAN
jgi:NADH-quinone oxidoreductase subunit M